MNRSEIKNIKVNSIIQIKTPGPILFGKVLHVTDYDLVHVDIIMLWKPLNKSPLKITNTWDYYFICNYVERIIEDHTTVKLIRALYE